MNNKNESSNTKLIRIFYIMKNFIINHLKLLCLGTGRIVALIFAVILMLIYIIASIGILAEFHEPIIGFINMIIGLGPDSPWFVVPAWIFVVVVSAFVWLGTMGMIISFPYNLTEKSEAAMQNIKYEQFVDAEEKRNRKMWEKEAKREKERAEWEKKVYGDRAESSSQQDQSSSQNQGSVNVETSEEKIQNAIVMFRLREGFTLDELKKARNELVKAYHSDNTHQAVDDIKLREINTKFDLLKPLAK